MDRRIDRGAATRRGIVGIATRLFAEEGYEAISIERVLRTCAISRGALYHHFASKEALFTAVLEATEERVAETTAAAARGAANPLDALRAGCAAWLHLAACDAEVRQIVLIDAPSVVGWQAWREIDGRHALGLLKAGLGMAAADRRQQPDKVDVYAHMLLAVLIEMALLIARSEDSEVAMRTAEEAVEQVVSRLVGVEPHAPWPGGSSG
jgi:AcrR family transcriptional regulator